MKTDSFFQTAFGNLYIDTASYGGKPSYEIFILGSLNFLHFNLAKEFWNNQEGGGVAIFQSEKPGQKDSLIIAWKQYYKDSIYAHTVKEEDFILDEVMACYKLDTSKPAEANVFPILATYSADAYKNWGITDSIVDAGLALNQFMAS